MTIEQTATMSEQLPTVWVLAPHATTPTSSVPRIDVDERPR